MKTINVAEREHMIDQTEYMLLHVVFVSSPEPHRLINEFVVYADMCRPSFRRLYTDSFITLHLVGIYRRRGDFSSVIIRQELSLLWQLAV